MEKTFTLRATGGGASMDASDPEAGTSHWRSAAETGRAEAFS